MLMLSIGNVHKKKVAGKGADWRWVALAGVGPYLIRITDFLLVLLAIYQINLT